MTDTAPAKTSNSTNAPATSMAELLAKKKSDFITFKKSDNVKGIITKLTSHEILVDIHAKTEAIVLEKDKGILRTLLSKLKVGDEVTVSILNPESDMGNPVVSLRRFIDTKAWDKLAALEKDHETIEVRVTDITKGGVIVGTDFGLSGFLPNSHTSFLQNQELTPGKKITVSVLELNKQDNKIIFSQKTTRKDEEFAAITKGLKVGQKISAVVSNVTSFGIFVSIQDQAVNSAPEKNTILDGLIHVSEISWEKVTNIADMFTIGQTIEALIIGIDQQTQRIDLSIKRLTKDPFEEIAEKFPVDKKIKGTVAKIAIDAVYLDLEEGVVGTIRKGKIPPSMKYEVGTLINATVAEVDKKRHRIILVPVLLEKPIGYR